jgi:hypothetical protein
VLIVPNNWDELQHYKDRSPPWIKLHKKLLDNFEFQRLPVASRALAPMLWLLASEDDTGRVDATPEKLAFRLRLSEQEVTDALKPLIEKEFFSHCKQPASKTLAKSRRAATPEAETEKRKNKDTSAGKLPTCPVQALVDLYHEILPELPQVRVMDAEREKAIGKFWGWVLTHPRPDGTARATNADEALDWTRQYFTRARDNDWLMGRTKRGAEHENWKCSIEYLLSTRGMKKVIEETEVPA